MPLAPVAVLGGAKAGAALAAAVAIDPDTVSHHAYDVAHSHGDATAFISLPKSIQAGLLGPGAGALHWIHEKAQHLLGHDHTADAAGPAQSRMVEYYASGCHHCKDLEPIWRDAESKWAQAQGATAKDVIWEQKQCLDENWKPGADFKECEAQGIRGFPTVRFFGPGSQKGDDFMMRRTPDELVHFAQTGAHPEGGVLPRDPNDMSDMKFVDFYAASCPHCKHLDPVWDKVHSQWDKLAQGEDVPLIQFEKKECYDDHWQPGRDSALCEKLHVHSFPSMKLMVPDPNGHGFIPVDYDGDRTPEAMLDFLRDKAGLPHVEPSPSLPAPSQDLHDAQNDASLSEAMKDAHPATAPAARLDDGLQRLRQAVQTIGAMANHAEDLARQSMQDADNVDADLAKLEISAPIANKVQEVVSTASVSLPLLGLSCLTSRKTRAKQQVQTTPSSITDFI